MIERVSSGYLSGTHDAAWDENSKIAEISENSDEESDPNAFRGKNESFVKGLGAKLNLLERLNSKKWAKDNPPDTKPDDHQSPEKK